MNIERLTREKIDVEPTTDRFLGETRLMQDWSDKMVDLIINGVTLNGIDKDELRALLRQTYGALKRYEQIGAFASPFINDPAAIVAMAFAELYPDKKYNAQLVPSIVNEAGEQVCGCTTFSTDPDEPPLVEVSGQLPGVHFPEILAHELAHVAVGELMEHGQEWEDAFEAINDKYDEIAVAIFGPQPELEPSDVITPHKVGDGGILAMPLAENVPFPTNDGWELTHCPVCGAECWETDLAREALKVEPELRVACTTCALQGLDGSEK